MAYANNKTVENSANVEAFLDEIESDNRREDAKEIHELMQSVTNEPAKMWGSSIVGYGSYHYKYESGREGDMMKVGFSPRKQNLTLYIMPGFHRFDEIMTKLGKYKTGKSCLYIKSLMDIDLAQLRELIKSSYLYMTDKYG